MRLARAVLWPRSRCSRGLWPRQSIRSQETKIDEAMAPVIPTPKIKCVPAHGNDIREGPGELAQPLPVFGLQSCLGIRYSGQRFIRLFGGLVATVLSAMRACRLHAIC
jgi:hypothetical protein